MLETSDVSGCVVFEVVTTGLVEASWVVVEVVGRRVVEDSMVV